MSTIFADTIGKVLKEQRIAKGLTKVDVANELGYSTSSILNMERGNECVLWMRYASYMHMLGLTWSLESKETLSEQTT